MRGRLPGKSAADTSQTFLTCGPQVGCDLTSKSEQVGRLHQEKKGSA